MKADAIVKRILDDARLEAKRILAEAEERVLEIEQSAQAEKNRKAEESAAQTRLDCAALREEMLMMAQLQERKERLSEKRQVIDRAFSEALSMLEAMPEDQMRSFYVKIIEENARGGESIIASPQLTALFTKDTLQTINDGLKRAGKQGSVVLSDEVRTQLSGVILKKDDCETNCTFTALLHISRPSFESTVAKMLFGDGQ